MQFITSARSSARSARSQKSEAEEKERAEKVAKAQRVACCLFIQVIMFMAGFLFLVVLHGVTSYFIVFLFV
jgi:hypothetical protein